MSNVGSPITTSLIQTAAAQQVIGKARDRERAVAADGRPNEDQVELRAAGIDEADAVRRLPQNDSEEAGQEQRSHRRETGSHPREGIDLRA
jgi:hypothetical protein